MKYLIIGLGNYGYQYKNTRHNIGFNVLDALIGASDIVFEQKRYAFVSNYKFKGRTLILVKPATYMNLSGKAVNYWLKKENVPINNSLIVVDDINLDFGIIRIKSKGSHGGHNGLINITQTLNTTNYPRMRIGIGSNFSRGKQADYVLGKWSEKELTFLPEKIELMTQAIKSFVTIGIEKTMNNYNVKKLEP